MSTAPMSTSTICRSVPRTGSRPDKWALLAVCLALLPAQGSDSTAGKRKPRPAAGPQAAFDAALDAQKSAISDCFMEHGVKKGADSVKLEIKVLVNRSGQIFSTELQVTQNGGDQAAMSECVKQSLTLARFPPNRSSLTELRRIWTFSTKS